MKVAAGGGASAVLASPGPIPEWLALSLGTVHQTLGKALTTRTDKPGVTHSALQWHILCVLHHELIRHE